MYDLDKWYDKSFYRRCLREKRHVYGQVAVVIEKYFRFGSVLELGCGVVPLLSYFSCKTKKGIEGSKFACSVNTDVILHDLREPYYDDNHYDLAISIEVAEHIEQEYADIFCDTLTRHADTVLLTAAPRGQRGTQHVNCQPQAYWRRKMCERGFTLVDKPQFVVDIKDKCTARFGHTWRNMMVFERE